MTWSFSKQTSVKISDIQDGNVTNRTDLYSRHTDLDTLRLYSSLDALSFQSFQSWSVKYSVHQLRGSVEVVRQVERSN